MLLQLSDPLLAPFLGSWRLDPLSMQVVKKLIGSREALASVEAALAYTRKYGNEEVFRRFLTRCKDDRVVIAPRQITFHHHGKAPFTLPIQKVAKEGRRTVIHCIQKPPYPVGPVAYAFHFTADRLVMREQSGLRRTAITHRFYLDT